MPRIIKELTSSASVGINHAVIGKDEPKANVILGTYILKARRLLKQSQGNEPSDNMVNQLAFVLMKKDRRNAK